MGITIYKKVKLSIRMAPEVLIAIIGTGETILTVFGMFFVNRYYNLRDKKKIHKVEEGIDTGLKLSEKLTHIKDHIEASRVSIWVFHNGGYYYTGEPVQKLSCIADIHAEELNSMMPDFQNVPIHLFLRHLDILKNNDMFFEYNELKHRDTLSKLNESYENVSVGAYKILNKRGEWVGILNIAFNNHTDIEPTADAFLRLQLHSIADILGHIDS